MGPPASKSPRTRLLPQDPSTTSSSTTSNSTSSSTSSRTSSSRTYTNTSSSRWWSHLRPAAPACGGSSSSAVEVQGADWARPQQLLGTQQAAQPQQGPQLWTLAPLPQQAAVTPAAVMPAAAAAAVEPVVAGGDGPSNRLLDKQLPLLALHAAPLAARHLNARAAVAAAAAAVRLACPRLRLTLLTRWWTRLDSAPAQTLWR